MATDFYRILRCRRSKLRHCPIAFRERLCSLLKTILRSCVERTAFLRLIRFQTPPTISRTILVLAAAETLAWRNARSIPRPSFRELNFSRFLLRLITLVIQNPPVSFGVVELFKILGVHRRVEILKTGF